MKHKLFFFLLTLSLTNLVQASSNTDHTPLRFTVNQYDYNYYNKPVNHYENQWDRNTSTSVLNTATAQWHISTKYLPTDTTSSHLKLQVVFRLYDGYESSANVGVDIPVENWSRENYVLFPGSVYNGNRFQSRKIAYSPKLLDPKDIGTNKPMIISDIPRLDINNGLSRIQEASGGMSVPCVGYFSPKDQYSGLVFFPQGNAWGDYGINLEENRSRSQAVISVKSPMVRESYQYGSITTIDKPADFKKGDSVIFVLDIYKFPSTKLQDLFDTCLVVRENVVPKSSYVPLYPFSHCFSVQEDKFNNQNFVSDWGYYSVGLRENYFQDWQIGWTGGMISTYPLLFAGDETSTTNVLRNFDWLCNGGISPSGLFWCSGEKGNIWIGGDTRKPHTKNWHLIRKSGDGLYYIMKQFDLMNKKNIEIKSNWSSSVKKVANAFVKLWENNGQFGQFVDNISGEIQVGGSTSGAIIPAAMSLASKFYNEPKYLEVAEASAEHYYRKYISKGITCGGPGDALQNPDSESAYAMLESFVTLYELTENNKWLQYAKDMASQYATWVFNYDYNFPAHTLFGKLNIHSNGAVLANAQNKHASPGICAYSGSALLRLYRATKNEKYLEILKSTAFNLPQYMSHKDRPIKGMPAGWINERVNTSSWSPGERIGEIFNGSTWAETSLMLTYIEVPGIYVDLSRKQVTAIDNIDVEVLRITNKSVTLEVQNPTNYKAEIRVLVDNDQSVVNPLEPNYLLNTQIISLDANQKKTVKLKYRN